MNWAVSLAALVLFACSRPTLDTKSMSNDDLTSELRRESLAGRTRADAPSLLRALAAGPRVLPPLLEELESARAPYHAYYLASEAVRELDPVRFGALDQVVELRIYVEALRHAMVFDDWGFPGGARPARDEWLRGLAGPAVALLTPLLDDRRAAPILGSQEATLARARGNRICDYALALVLELRGESRPLPATPADRDRLIAELRATLAHGGARPTPSNSDDELLRALVADAAQGRCEPDSDAFRRAIQRGPALVPKLLELLRDPTGQHRFLALEAVRSLSPSDYAALDASQRARVYAQALRTTRAFDDFGLPNRPLEAGRALVALGPAALGALRPLLEDEREAGAFDGELNTMLRKRRVRVADFALFFSLAARGERPDFPSDREERDRLIAAFKKAAP